MSDADPPDDSEDEADPEAESEAENEADRPPAGELGASRGLDATPDHVLDLAASCVRFVKRALDIQLDYQPETLPVLDHWLRTGKEAAIERPEAALLLAHAAGAYFGEVVRRRHASWWRTDDDDPGSYRIELRDVFLSFAPVDVARDALCLDRTPDGEELDISSFDLDDDDREAVKGRLAELPEVGEDEYRAPSTRLEVLDIVVDAIRQRRAAEDVTSLPLEPDDYGPTIH
jgi:hypothetical protein